MRERQIDKNELDSHLERIKFHSKQALIVVKCNLTILVPETSGIWVVFGFFSWRTRRERERETGNCNLNPVKWVNN